MSQQAIWFFAGFLTTVLLLMRALNYLLRPLEQIRRQAAEIEQHHFGEAIPLPKTFELRQVVQAINTLSGKLVLQFKEQASEAEMLRERVYKDAVSGLGNRAYFVGQVNAWIAEGGQGGILLVAVDVLEEIYREEGFAARDNMVKSIASCLRGLLQGKSESAVARISATEYALLYPAADKEELRVLAEQINGRIADLVVNPIDESKPLSVIGMVMREHDEDLSALLTKADNALSQARRERRGAVVMEDNGRPGMMGRLAWRDLVLDAINNQLLNFKAQPACRFDNKTIIHSELFASIHKNGHDYFAGQFMPAIEQFELGADFDKTVLESVITRLEDDDKLTLAVNVMAGSLCNDAFSTWLEGFLQKHISVKGRLYFEIPEGAIMKHRQEVDRFVETIRKLGFEWGVDHYGRHFQSLGYLEVLQPAYVKVDHGYTSQVLEDGGDTAFLAAICRAARNAGIVTIATRVENERQVKLLEQLHIDGYQGFVRPAQILN